MLVGVRRSTARFSLCRRPNPPNGPLSFWAACMSRTYSSIQHPITRIIPIFEQRKRRYIYPYYHYQESPSPSCVDSTLLVCSRLRLLVSISTRDSENSKPSLVSWISRRCLESSSKPALAFRYRSPQMRITTSTSKQAYSSTLAAWLVGVSPRRLLLRNAVLCARALWACATRTKSARCSCLMILPYVAVGVHLSAEI